MEDTILGRAKGGLMRAQRLSPDERIAIAKKGSAARWGTRPLTSSHKGNFQEEFGIDVECYVLDDATRTPVISQTGMSRALGLSARGNAFPRFLAGQGISKIVGAELAEKMTKPLMFQWVGRGAQGIVYGFDARLLIDLCKCIIDAEANSTLPKRYLRVVRQAHIIVGASAKAGIAGLIYALAGYSPSTEEVIAAFKLYIQEEARKYEPEFPNEIYMQWHRLYEIRVPVRGKPMFFSYLTVRHIYYPLAQSRGKIYELLKALRAKDADRRRKLFQFLSEIGSRALRVHLGRVLEMAESSNTRNEYERKIEQRFGEQRELALIVPAPSSASQPPSEQSPDDAS